MGRADEHDREGREVEDALDPRPAAHDRRGLGKHEEEVEEHGPEEERQGVAQHHEGPGEGSYPLGSEREGVARHEKDEGQGEQQARLALGPKEEHREAGQGEEQVHRDPAQAEAHRPAPFVGGGGEAEVRRGGRRALSQCGTDREADGGRTTTRPPDPAPRGPRGRGSRLPLGGRPRAPGTAPVPRSRRCPGRWAGSPDSRRSYRGARSPRRSGPRSPGGGRRAGRAAVAGRRSRASGAWPMRPRWNHTRRHGRYTPRPQFAPGVSFSTPPGSCIARLCRSAEREPSYTPPAREGGRHEAQGLRAHRRAGRGRLGSRGRRPRRRRRPRRPRARAASGPRRSSAARRRWPRASTPS